MATKVAGELKDSILSKLFEIQRQVRQKEGYGFNPVLLNDFLQRGVEGKFNVSWETWKTIKRDSDLKTSEDFLKALNKKGFRVSDWAKDIISKDAFKKSLESEQECNLVLLSTSQLTGKRGNATTQEVFAGAERLGFQKCPAWVGSQLRLDYKDQVNGEWIRVGMEPITDSDGGPDVFVVLCGGSGHWLGAFYARPGGVWGPADLWIFSLPCK